MNILTRPYKNCARPVATSGLTLVELMIAVAILGVVLTAVSGVFMSMSTLWERTDNMHKAQITLSEAAKRLTQDMQNAVNCIILSRYSSGDTLILYLPSLTNDGVYSPEIFNNKLQYANHDIKVYYISDSSGSPSRQGDILWSGTASYRFNVYTVTPDMATSLWPSTYLGQIQPVSKLQIQRTSSDPDNVYTVLIQVPEREKGADTKATLQFKVLMRNHQ